LKIGIPIQSKKKGFEANSWLDGGLGGDGTLAPAWGADAAACWMNNPRDMIQLQNELYWARSRWNNQLLPQSDWSSQTSEELRKYWGWNEIPVAKKIVYDPQQWDAIIIKLPADACNTGDWEKMMIRAACLLLRRISLNTTWTSL